MPRDGDHHGPAAAMWLTLATLAPRVSASGNNILVGALNGLKIAIVRKPAGEVGAHTHLLILAASGQAADAPSLAHATTAPPAKPPRRPPRRRRARSLGRSNESVAGLVQVEDDRIPF